MPQKQKSNPLRVSIQFSKEDNTQLKAAEILNFKGRKKAAYIAKAIDFYENNQKNGMSISDIESIVERMIKQKKYFCPEENEHIVAIATVDVKKEDKKSEHTATVSVAPSADCNLLKTNQETSARVENGEESAMKDFVSEVLAGFSAF